MATASGQHAEDIDGFQPSIPGGASEDAGGKGPFTHVASGVNIPQVLLVIGGGSASPAGSSATQPTEGQQVVANTP